MLLSSFSFIQIKRRLEENWMPIHYNVKKNTVLKM